MMRKLLLIIRRLIDVSLDESSGGPTHQQKVTVVGDNNSFIIINGNKAFTNLSLPKNQTKVKHFPPEKSGKS